MITVDITHYTLLKALVVPKSSLSIISDLFCFIGITTSYTFRIGQSRFLISSPGGVLRLGARTDQKASTEEQNRGRGCDGWVSKGPRIRMTQEETLAKQDERSK